MANCIVNTHLRFLKLIFNETDAIPGQFLPLPSTTVQPAAARGLKTTHCSVLLFYGCCELSLKQQHFSGKER